MVQSFVTELSSPDLVNVYSYGLLGISGTSVAPNIVTCWGAGTSAQGGAKPKTRSSSRPLAQPRRYSPTHHSSYTHVTLTIGLLNISNT